MTMRAARQPLFSDRGVRVNAVSPGPGDDADPQGVPTGLRRPRVDEDIARVGRVGAPADIAPAALFLCSDGARWISGANLPVDRRARGFDQRERPWLLSRGGKMSIGAQSTRRLCDGRI